MPITKVMPLLVFFFNERSDIHKSFPKLFNDNRSPIVKSCGELRRLSKTYGFQKTVYDCADDRITEVEKIHQSYLLQVLVFLSYELDNAYAQKAQREFEDQQRKLKRH